MRQFANRTQAYIASNDAIAKAQGKALKYDFIVIVADSEVTLMRPISDRAKTFTDNIAAAWATIPSASDHKGLGTMLAFGPGYFNDVLDALTDQGMSIAVFQ